MSDGHGWCKHLREPMGMLCGARPAANKAMDEVRHEFQRQLDLRTSAKKRFATLSNDARDAGGMNSLIDVAASKKRKTGDGDSAGTGSLMGGGLTQRMHLTQTRSKLG